MGLGRNALLFPKFNPSEATKISVMGYRFTNRDDLDTAVDLWIDNRSTAKSTYGHINNWDVSRIKNFSLLFNAMDTFTSDISKWDVSSGTNFHAIFRLGLELTPPI